MIFLVLARLTLQSRRDNSHPAPGFNPGSIRPPHIAVPKGRLASSPGFQPGVKGANMKKSIFFLFFALLILALASIGPDTPADDPGQAAQEPPAPAGTPEAEDEPLETFEPTEKLSADSAVSFPVDI